MMRVVIIIFVVTWSSSVLWSQNSIPSKNLIQSNELLEKDKSTSFLYEFDMHWNLDNSIYSNRNGLGLGLNIGYTTRFSKNLGYSLYATGQTGVGHLGLTTRLNHYINDRLWLGYALGGGVGLDSYLSRTKHISLEASVNAKKHVAVFVRSNYVFDDPQERARSVINLGLRTRGKAAAWSSGVIIPAIILFSISAIRNSK